MSPRRRARSDADILAAAVQVIGRIGPGNLTLADVAREVSLSPATLVQRFGSKRGLLLAVARSAAAGPELAVDREPSAHPRRGWGPGAMHKTSHRSAVEALISLLVDCTRFFGSPETISNHLAFLEIDLTDPEFHEIALAHARKFGAELRALLDEAVRQGELRRTNTARLARAVEAIYNGSLLAWAIHRKGSSAKWVRGDLETLLGAFRRRRRGRA